MRHGSLVAGGCLALLSLIRLDRGDVPAALLLAAVAVAAVAWGVTAAGRPAPTDAVRDAARARSEARGWRRIALLGLALSVVGAFTFPPMALVVGGLTVYAVHRMRRAGGTLVTEPAR